MPQATTVVTRARFAQGLNYAPRSVATGTFDPDEVARHWGLHHQLEDCYILAVLAQKPLS